MSISRIDDDELWTALTALNPTQVQNFDILVAKDGRLCLILDIQHYLFEQTKLSVVKGLLTPERNDMLNWKVYEFKWEYPAVVLWRLVSRKEEK